MLSPFSSAGVGQHALHPKVVWLTGLPGSGKSTLAYAAESSLRARGLHSIVLDGDQLRQGLCADLGFSEADRRENIRRTAEVAKLFWLQGFVVLVALVSPLRSAREAAKAQLPDGVMLEVFCNSPLKVCQQRDPKGMYSRAAQGLIPNFTGLTAPYEVPLIPALQLDTGTQTVAASTQALLEFLQPFLQAP